MKNATDTSTVHYNAKEVIEWIRSGKWRGPVENIRRKFADVLADIRDRPAAKKAVAEDKKRLPGVMWSGTFSLRNRDALVLHSGLLCADLDELGDQLDVVEPKLRRSVHLWALFISPTGDGLKAVFRVSADPAKHKASYRAVEAHVRELTGVQIDRACSDVGRLCFLSYDPDAYLNEDAVELPHLPEPEKESKSKTSESEPQIQLRCEIATELVGQIDWDSETVGYCDCPAQERHSTKDAPRDCRVTLDGAPTIYCVHQSCREVIKDQNRELRSRIGKAEFAEKASGDNGAEALMPAVWFNQKFPTLAERFGHAVLVGKTETGRLFVRDIQEDFLAATLSAEASPDTPTVFLTSEQKFYTYCPVEGIYVQQRPPALLTRLSRLLLDCGRQAAGLLDTGNLQFRLRDSKKLVGVLKKAEHLLAVPDDFFSSDLTEFIACSNGMLCLSNRELLPFGPEYHRRNKLAVAFDPKAKSPLFLETLMRPALDPDDLDLVQRWSGMSLIGENPAQRIMILDGTAGGGKGTFVRVGVGIIGKQNVGTLRTRHLDDRFEIGRFLGKTLLYGADVPENFLNQRGAQVLKSLTGGDPITGEFKRSNETPLIECNFNILITCNSRLTVHLEGDTEAWRRRLVIVKYTKPQPKNVIADLSDQILDKEASGVLNWQLQGLDKVRAAGWQITLTAGQQRIVDDLLLESEGHIMFAKDSLFLAEGHEVTVQACYEAYVRYCSDRGWRTQPRQKFGPLIADVVARTYGLTIRHDLRRGMLTDQRGWKGIRLPCTEEEEEI